MADQREEACLRVSRGPAAESVELTVARLLVTDLDGTLLASDGEPHPSDLTAISLLRARGIHVSICTGRMYSGTRHVALALELDGPVGCLDGSHVVDVRTDQDVVRHPIDEFATGLLLSTLDAYDSPAFVFAGDAIFHDEQGEKYLDYVRAWSQRAERFDGLSELTSRTGTDGIAAIVSLGDERSIVGAVTTLEQQAKGHVQAVMFKVRHPDFLGRFGLLARRAGIDKATALEVIAKHYGVSLEETITVGDWHNDVSMLRAAGRSFAMAQAPQSVKDAATDVLKADAEVGGGIREAAKRAGLL